MPTLYRLQFWRNEHISFGLVPPLMQPTYLANATLLLQSPQNPKLSGILFFCLFISRVSANLFRPATLTAESRGESVVLTLTLSASI